ncbi:MAG TPA: HTTM domain-containing protein [Candidatus Binatia bacterium]
MADQNPSRFMNKLEELFGADLRSLAALRIGVALLILFDLIERSSDLIDHYTDFGAVPRSFAIGQSESRWFISIHLLSGVWEVQAILFLIAAVFTLAMLLGYKTRLATILSWVFLTSLITRNAYIVTGGDGMLRVVLFWGMFLPWGACYSIDRAWNSSWGKPPIRCLSWGTVGYVAQIFFIYWFTAILKTGVEWRSEGSAIYYALSVDYIATDLGQFLLQFPLLLKLITHGVFGFEIIGPLLLLCPFFTGPIRTAGVFAFWLFHIGILSTLRIGLFPWIGIISMFFFLPSWFWKKLFGGLKTEERMDLTIYYDGECDFCWKSVRLMKTFFLLPETRLVTAQNNPSIKTDMNLHNSWIVVDKGGVRHFRYDAIPIIAGASPILWPVVPLLKLSLARPVGEKVYARVSLHRKVACNINGSESAKSVRTFELSALANVAIVFLLLYLLLWNLGTIRNSGVRISERFRFLGEILRLDQTWGMFAPRPAKDDGWYVIPGKLSNGQTVDLFRGGTELDWKKPRLVSSIYKNHRWQKYMEGLRKIDALQINYAQYLCRSWNRSHDNGPRLEELEIFYLLEWTLPNYEYFTPEKRSILKYQCPTQPR